MSKAFRFYAGIGSRETPPDVLIKMELIAQILKTHDYVLSSGGAEGADKAFERGAGDMKDIYYSQDATKEAIDLALQHHPNPKALKRMGHYVLGLMGRNMQILLGYDLNKPVDFIICWTKDGGPSGGTGQALRYCIKNNITVYNLYFKEHEAQLYCRINTLTKEDR